ncbi:MAG TPA: caspase family protein [Leptolyngbyaceae cyanobacterium M65_K2018_010]|nr:caspase family protein [Leptolyngbyaceae cyanobacterium M65_K2018_010]
MGLKRRAFLQQTSRALAALGVGGTVLGPGPGQYSQALAKSSRRKLALLIGINQYPERAIDPILAQEVALRGCLTDVELQRQLLIHRFGFQASDILTLTGQEASRAGILQAIEEHLVQSSQSDDVVLLHFSGYGSQVRLEGQAGPSQMAWVTFDSRLPSEEKPALADLLEAEVVAQLQRLATPNLTTVIDAGGQDGGYLRWGNLKVRSRPTVPMGVLPTDWRGEVPALSSGLPPWPGLLLRAGQPGTLVLEGQWDGFSAGLLTYALTQSLWEALPNPNPQIFIQQLGDRLHRWVGPDQHPTLEEQRLAKAGVTPYSPPAALPPADGVFLPAKGGERPLGLWLGGVEPQLLSYLQPGTRFVTAPPQGSHDPTSPALELRLESRTGLKGTAKPVDTQATLPTTPQPLYEKLRLLPQSIALVVALDSQLKRVERVDATSALASLPFVASITAGERKADCLFGRLPVGPVATLTAALPSAPDNSLSPQPDSASPAESSYGLFAPNRTLVPGTMLAKEEAVKTAIGRLTPQLRSLLAVKLVRLTENRSASWLAVTATLEATQPKAKILGHQQTERSQPIHLISRTLGKANANPGDHLDRLELARDTRLLYRLANRSDSPLHVLVVSFESQGSCSALMVFPETVSPQEGTVLSHRGPALAPRQTRSIPNDPAGWGLPATGSMETYLVLSVRPFQHCFEVLEQDGNPSPLQTELRPVSQPLKLAQALLADLSDANWAGSTGLTGDFYALPQDQWVTFGFNYAISGV